MRTKRTEKLTKLIFQQANYFIDVVLYSPIKFETRVNLMEKTKTKQIIFHLFGIFSFSTCDK